MNRVAVAALALAAVVPACLPSRGAVFGPVDADLQRRLGLDVSWSASQDSRVPAAVAELLTRPLDLDAALRIAVANNRWLQARYDELGIAAASVAEATVLAPLEIDASYEMALSGGGSEIELDAVQDVLDLLLLPQRRGSARAELAAARTRAIGATVELVAEVEVAFYDLVAAQQQLELRQTAFDAAGASAEIIERMHGAGNATDLDLARERDQREQARIEVARAEVEVEVAREEINKVLGLSGDDTRWSVAGRLPEVPAGAPALDDLEAVAIDESLELRAIRHDAEAAAKRLGLARIRTVLPGLGLGVAVGRKDDEGWHVGPAIRIALPIFDQQQGPRARGNAELRRARNELTAMAVDVRANARAARQIALEAHAEAIHLRDTILPLRQQVLDETLKQYNAMNASTFELLAARRDLVDAGRQYIDAVHRYWTAIADVTALRRGVTPEVETRNDGDVGEGRRDGDH